MKNVLKILEHLRKLEYMQNISFSSSKTNLVYLKPI